MNSASPIHLKKKEFEKKLSAIDAACSEDALAERLIRMGYNESMIGGLRYFSKGGGKKNIIISNTEENIIIQFERAENAAAKIVNEQSGKKFTLVYVCFAQTAHGAKNIFDKYLSYEIAADRQSGVNNMRPVVYDKKGERFVFNDFHEFRFAYNDAWKIITHDIIGKTNGKKIFEA